MSFFIPLPNLHFCFRKFSSVFQRYHNLILLFFLLLPPIQPLSPFSFVFYPLVLISPMETNFLTFPAIYSGRCFFFPFPLTHSIFRILFIIFVGGTLKTRYYISQYFPVILPQLLNCTHEWWPSLPCIRAFLIGRKNRRRW